MDENLKIIYILIGSGTKPLAGYGQFEGEFIQTCERQLKNCKANNSACITHSEYKIYYQNEDNITYLIMTIPSYPMPAAVACIESMRKEFGTNLHGRNFAGVKDYGLNSELKEKLKMKYEYYTENTEIVDEKLQDLKKVMMKFKDEVVKAADALNERGDLLNEMQNKAKDLEQDSYSFKKGAIQVRRTECKKKAIYIVVIIVIIAIIIGIIVAIVK